jgi:hypothetical protein
MVGAPAQAVRIRLIRRRQFRVRRLALSLVEVKRRFVMGKPSNQKRSSRGDYTLVVSRRAEPLYSAV